MSAVFLEEGRQSPESIAALLCGYLAGARSSLEIAIYDLALDGGALDQLRSTLRALNARGVRPRLVYNFEHHPKSHVPPPQMIVVPGDLLRLCDVRAVPGKPDLMHHKYVIRDGESVWTGSANWTNDSWSRQENVIVRLESPGLARAYAADFEQLWSTGHVQHSGRVAPAWVPLSGAGRALPYFTPGCAAALTADIAARLAGARRRIRVCSPVLTASPILRALAEMAGNRGGVDARGAVDATQMDGVRRLWRQNPESAWKLEASRAVFHGIPFSGKHSTPFGEGTVHDFMHAKCVVVDDTTFVGSYNLSQAGQENAENVVEIEDQGVADMFAAFVDRVASRYPAMRG